MKSRLLLQVLIALLLVGCAAPHPVTFYANRVNEQKPCCSSFRDMSYVKLPMGETREFSIDSGAPVFLFKDGRSRFVAIELPSRAGPTALKLETHVVRLWIEPTVFSPFVIFVDQAFERIDEVAPTLGLRTESFAGRYWESRVAVPADATYAIVYTKPAVYLGFMYYKPEKSFAFVPGKVPFAVPTQSVPILAGPHGKLLLEIGASK